MARKNARPAARKRKAKLAEGMSAPKRRTPRPMPPPDLIMTEIAAASALLSGLLRKVERDDEATRP